MSANTREHRLQPWTAGNDKQCVTQAVTFMHHGRLLLRLAVIPAARVCTTLLILSYSIFDDDGLQAAR